MKRRDLSILFLIAILFQGCPYVCPYIASGESEAPDKISFKDLQGCHKLEKLWISSYSQEASLECVKDCFVDSIRYQQKKVYKADTNFQDTDTSLANPLWRLDTTVYDTAVVKILNPKIDGFYYDNLQIGNWETNSDDYLKRFENGWTLCRE